MYRVFMEWFVWQRKTGRILNWNWIFYAKRGSCSLSRAAVWFCRRLSTLVVVFLIKLQSTFRRRIRDWSRQRNLLLSISFEGGFRHFEKCFFNTQAFYSTRLVKHHVIVVFGPCLALCRWNLAIGFLIEFVSNADEGEWLRVARASIFIEAISPPTKRVETLRICDVINECATVSTAIEGIAEWLELFLAGSIPDL